MRKSSHQTENEIQNFRAEEWEDAVDLFKNKKRGTCLLKHYSLYSYELQLY